MKRKQSSSSVKSSSMIPIVLVLYHREEETKEMLERLARVTSNYSLIVVNNGFDDTEYLEQLEMLLSLKP